jgi:hypothetical protein
MIRRTDAEWLSGDILDAVLLWQKHDRYTPFSLSIYTYQGEDTCVQFMQS